MEEPLELMTYGRTFGTKMGEVRWDKVAEGLGCRAKYVAKLEDLEPALSMAKEGDGPTVVCVRTDQAANLSVPQDVLIRFFEVYQGPVGQ